MALSDGPLIVGYKTIPADPNTTPGIICQLQSGGPTIIHEESAANHKIEFIDGHYWSADGKVYLVGSDYDSPPQLGNGRVWTWDGTSLAIDRSFPAAVLQDDFLVSCITEFNGALYIGVHNIVAGTPTGGRVYRQTAPGTGWVEVFNFLFGTIEGPVFLKEVQGQLFVCLDTQNVVGAFSFAYSPTGDPGSWVLGPWVGGGIAYGPRSVFWDGVQWVYTCVDQTGFPLLSVAWFTAPVLGGPWAGPTVIIGTGDTGKIFTDGADWYTTMNNQPHTFKWDREAGSWSSWRAEPVAVNASPTLRANDGALHDGSVYLPLNLLGDAFYGKDLDPPVALPNTTVFVPNSFISTPTAPPVWDVVDIEPADWGAGPFCDETTSGSVTVHAGSALEIRGNLGLDTPSYYELQFGPTCPDLPDDWDIQVELELTSLPSLKDDDGDRLFIWVHDSDLSRKTRIGLSRQGISIYKMDAYSDLVEGSSIALENGATVTLKLTGRGSDSPFYRSYLSVQGQGVAYKHGFASYYKTGPTSTLRIEAVGSPSLPSIVKVLSIKGRTHSFALDDPLSIDCIKPEAVIV